MAPDVAFIGLHCGRTLNDIEEKNRRVRAASMMGQLLIDRIIRHESDANAGWDGRLARISVSEYVSRFRDRVPTRMKGSEFIERFGSEISWAGEIEPRFVYKVRSRTEHHLYEHSRASQFVEALAGGARTSDRAALSDAGECMYASHWSYGQRCGLGSVEADILVNLIREYGEDRDIFGVRMGGRGCGGVLTAMIRSTERAHAALDQAVRAYESRTGLSVMRLEGAGTGAMVSGAQVP
jgi:galactokinase